MKKMTIMKARAASLFYLKRSLKVQLTAFFIVVSILDAHSENYDQKRKNSKESLLNLTVKSTDQKKVQGVVKDDKGMPLTGVTISVNGGKQGTVTNFDGKYEIAVNEGDVVSFSFIGFETKIIKITNQVLLNVTLVASINKLDDLVLVGYGKMSRDKITGAVTKLDTKVLQNTQNVSFADALIGVVPGLFVQESFTSPDAPPSILLRGIGSISASTDPLIVVDGVQMPRSGLGAFALNAADIQDISVLKDAASTSIYGSKGTNGVIMITTKRGNRNTKMKVTFNTRLGMKMADQSFTNDLMKGSQKLDFEESLGFYKSNPALLQSRRAAGNNVNWADLLLKNEINRENDISFSGGSDKANYYTSITYNNVNNIFDGQYKRYTVATRVDFDLGKKIKVGFSGNFSNVNEQDGRTVGSPFINSFLLNPWLTVFDDKGNPLRLLDIASSSGAPYNPLFIRENTNANANRKNIGGSVNLTYTPFKWLSLNGVLGANYNNSKNSNYENVIVKGGTLTVNNSDNNNYTGTLTATIAKKFQKHNFDLVLGNEVNEYETNSLNVLANTFNSDAIQIVSAAKTITSVTQQKSQAGSLSYFSRLNYNFDNTYNLSLSFRRDGSSRFGDNNKYANFWSVGTSWNVHRDLFKDNKTISSLKFRASIGTSGNDFIGDFASQSLYGYKSQMTYAGSTVPYLTRGENPNLTWEKNYNKNFGIDYGFFNNRISGTVDYYIRDTKDLLNNKPIPLTSGFSELISNIGNFRNEGVEIGLHTVNLKGKDFNWTTDFNIAFNKGTVIALSDKKDILFNSGSTVFQEGSAIRSFYIADWAGVNPVTGFNQYRKQDGTLVDYNTNKTTTNATEISNLRQVSNKTAMPKYYGGLTNTFRYKQLDLSVLVSYAGGHYVLNEGIYNLYNNPGYNQSTAVLKAWKNPGDQSNLAVRQVNTTNPNAFLESDYKSSTQFLENASYIKLKNVALGYTLQRSILEKTGIESLRIYVQGQNLFTKTAVSYIDPEYATAAGGIGLSSSIVRAYSLGLNASF
ncbi:SusC/RagA family TonB-linked outer membrane protein [Flavobacterium sp. N502540]|uniref:SusC/RagA family TonB-linked outer membrane protein n=1 Tax=Flavobacterium sp. N502540 TaxID=2986838 RepID=UPI002224C9B9|nr:SusC/RagA family TonB-linked outer membrane protein [Flavobacterium sp. N502540]